MTAKQLTYLFVIFFAFTNCKKNHPTHEEVLSDIFPQLIDSLDIKWSPLLPSWSERSFDNISNVVVDSIRHRHLISEDKKFLRRYDSIDSRMVIGVRDSCTFLDWKGYDINFYNNEDISNVIAFNKRCRRKNEPHYLNFNLISVPTNVTLISVSEIERKYSNRSIGWDRKFAGFINISEIYFDKENTHGLLQIDYSFFPVSESYYRYLIVIECVNKKWKVKRLFLNGIS
jgi:hypothetical protein